MSKINQEKENAVPAPSMPQSKSNSPFSLEKKTIKTTKSVNFKNFSSNVAFDQRHSPNLKLNRSKSPVLNQRKHSKPDNISYNLMRKLKTDIEDNELKLKKGLSSKDISTSLSSINKDLSNKTNSKSIATLLPTKKINLGEEKKNYKIFAIGKIFIFLIIFDKIYKNN